MVPFSKSFNTYKAKKTYIHTSNIPTHNIKTHRIHPSSNHPSQPTNRLSLPTHHHIYKSSSNGLNPCAVPIRSSKKNLNLSTAALSAIHFPNSVGFVPGISSASGYPAGASTSFLTLQLPLASWFSFDRMNECSNFALSGCGASFRIAPVCGHVTKAPEVAGKEML